MTFLDHTLHFVERYRCMHFHKVAVLFYHKKIRLLPLAIRKNLPAEAHQPVSSSIFLHNISPSVCVNPDSIVICESLISYCQEIQFETTRS